MESRNVQFEDVARAVFMAVIGYLAVSLMLTIFISFLSFITSSSPSTFTSNIIFQHVGAVLNEVLFFLIFLFFYKKRNMRNEIFVARNKNKISIPLIFVIIIFSVIILLASLNFTLLMNHLFSFFAPQRSDGVAIKNFADFLLSIITMCILPAFCEELLFRGIIFSGLKNRFSLLTACLLASFIFAIIHMSIFSFVYQFLLGIVLCLLFYYTSFIVYGMILHFMNNFLVLIIEYIFGDSFPLLFSDFSPTSIIYTILIFLVGILLVSLFFYFYKSHLKKKKYFENEQKNEQNLSKNDNFSSNLDKNEIFFEKKEVETTKLILEKQNNYTNKKSSFILIVAIGFCIIINLIFTFMGAL